MFTHAQSHCSDANVQKRLTALHPPVLDDFHSIAWIYTCASMVPQLTPCCPSTAIVCRNNELAPPISSSLQCEQKTWSYTVSVSILFILEILLDTLRSMVRSPISTTRPPRMSGLTLGTTFSFLPWLYSDLLMAVSRRRRSLSSSFCTQHSQHMFSQRFLDMWLPALE